MKTALIGYTGFVGGNINAQTAFDDVYNTANIHEIDGKEYDLVVSAATYAEMWKINQDPEGDRAQIDSLIERIKNVKVAKFVLISTVGVYKSPNGSNEDTPIELDGLTAYGTNRWHLEQFVRDNFDSTIIRLPGLFGAGLKKNVIYDLLNNNLVEKIHQAGTYQYYDLSRIWQDISTALENSVPLLNLATPPVTTKEVAKEAFDQDFTNEPADIKPAYWDMHTKYSGLFGGPENYIMSKQEELERIKAFVQSQRV